MIVYQPANQMEEEKMKKRMRMIASLSVVALLALGGCQLLQGGIEDMKSSVTGLPMVLQTYDENSLVLDHIEGKSISIQPEAKFSQRISEDSNTKSSVLSITVGGKSMYHVGSSMIAYDSALTNYFDELDDRVEMLNADNSIPFMSRMKNKFVQDWAGMNMVVLIRSQNGTPLATFTGKRVSIQATSIDKSTAFLIDGKRLFVYRCDYTIYEQDLLGS